MADHFDKIQNFQTQWKVFQISAVYPVIRSTVVASLQLLDLKMLSTKLLRIIQRTGPLCGSTCARSQVYMLMVPQSALGHQTRLVNMQSLETSPEICLKRMKKSSLMN